MSAIPTKSFFCHHCQLLVFLPLVAVALSAPSCPTCSGGASLHERPNPSIPYQPTATAEDSLPILSRNHNSSSLSLASSSTHPSPTFSTDLIRRALIDADDEDDAGGSVTVSATPSIAAFLKLPTRTVTEEKLNSDEFKQHCMICLDEFEMGNEVKEMPCKHVFHCCCLSPWLESRNSCPICRFQLPKDSEMDYGDEDEDMVHGSQ